ncbi:hypothetical protein JKF63_06578 [Porcisia hertigi]|uniref:Arp2/3 complex 41 kDa subunit n=1 Tax=Porcisia hertigi TaxID=2761500 RepID=A0A836I939_9TRYP|nr:hypothetical protein JKF63_06578 [Porcisia hertigi]
MVSVSCITHTTSEGDNGHAVPRLLSRSRAPSLVALSFNHDGSRVAYAVRRVQTLPRNGACEDACCIFVANTNVPAPSASRSPLPPVPCAAVAPLAQWTVLQVLSGIHDAPITALSWCQRTGALLSTSADRGACVWVPQSNESTAKEETRQASKEEVYGAACNGSESASACLGGIEAAPFCLVPQIVMLSVEVLLCPTSVAWSVEGTKLYIGTSGGTVAVGRYDARQKWWICRLIDDHGRPPNGDPSADTSTPSSTSGRAVTALAAHPVDNTRIAVARLDGTVQVFSTHLKSVDGALAGSGRGHSSGDNAGATAKPFSCTYLSHFLPCCVHGLAWSPSGQQLAVVGHDSALHVWNWNASRSSSLGSPGGTHTSADNRPSVGDVDECEAAHTVLLRLSQVPLLRCEFASEDVLVAVGFEGRLDAFESSAPSTQPGVQSQRTWQLVPQHTVTQRAKGARGAADTSTHLLPRAPANVEVEDREMKTPRSGGQTAPSRLGVPKGIVAHERQAADIATGSPATQHVDDRPPHAWPNNLLVRIPSSGGAAAAADTMDATFVSTGHDGCVHLWRVCGTTLGVHQ